MTLDDPQRKKVAAWIAEGLKLSEIQNRIASELGVRLTYMDVRLLVDDLKLVPKDPEPPKAPAPSTLDAKKETAPGKEAAALTSQEEEAVPGNLSLVVDQIARPGALVSGKVTFSDGKKAEWYLDQTGRLGLVAQEKGYRPSQSDVQQFQTVLESELAKLGF